MKLAVQPPKVEIIQEPCILQYSSQQPKATKIARKLQQPTFLRVPEPQMRNMTAKSKKSYYEWDSDVTSSIDEKCDRLTDDKKRWVKEVSVLSPLIVKEVSRCHNRH